MSETVSECTASMGKSNLICMGKPSLLLSASESTSARLHPAAECKVPGCLVELALPFTHLFLLFREHAERRPRRASLEFSSVCRTACVSCSCWTQASEGCFNAAVYEHFVFEWWMEDICTLGVCRCLWDAGQNKGVHNCHSLLHPQHRQQGERMPASLWHSKFIASRASLSVQWSVQQCVGSLEDSWISAEVWNQEFSKVTV